MVALAFFNVFLHRNSDTVISHNWKTFIWLMERHQCKRIPFFIYIISTNI